MVHIRAWTVFWKVKNEYRTVFWKYMPSEPHLEILPMWYILHVQCFREDINWRVAEPGKVAMIVYHGGYCEIRTPEIKPSRNNVSAQPAPWWWWIEGRFFRKGKWPQNECRQTTMTARRHFLFIIRARAHWLRCFAPGISESICPAGVEFKRGRTSSSHLRKQMPFALRDAAKE